MKQVKTHYNQEATGYVEIRDKACLWLLHVVNLDCDLSSMFLRCGCCQRRGKRRCPDENGMLLSNIVHVFNLFFPADWENLIASAVSEQEYHKKCLKALSHLGIQTCDYYVSEQH